MLNYQKRQEELTLNPSVEGLTTEELMELSGGRQYTWYGGYYGITWGESLMLWGVNNVYGFGT